MTWRHLKIYLLTMAVALACWAVTWSAAEWRRGIQCERVVASGAVMADSAEVVALARVPQAPLYDIDPVVIEDRVRRHPWVREARVTRHPSGTLLIRVIERRPVAMAIEADGDIAYYLDKHGFRLPFVRGHGFDVPLIHGIDEPMGHVVPVRNESARELLHLLGEIDDATNKLISEIAIAEGSVTLQTPAYRGQSALVRLGKDDYERKLRELRAYWDQVVMTGRTEKVRTIDLRFHSQIVTN